ACDFRGRCSPRGDAAVAKTERCLVAGRRLHALAARVLGLLPPSKILARASQVGSFIHPPRLISSPLTSFLVRFCSPVWISFLKRMRFFDLDGRNSISVVLRTLDWTSGKQDGMLGLI
ncbi:hypothetical protein BHM03_00048895, partial [Ensete ventricosum]